jgi:hypothetical protein
LLKKEVMIKNHLSTHFQTTRRAFLALARGTGHNDSHLRIKDFQIFLSSNEETRYLSEEKFLRELFIKRDMLIHPEDDRIRFEAFRLWIGPKIERTEGYYFRHDSFHNPAFDKSREKFSNGSQSPRNITKLHPI